MSSASKKLRACLMCSYVATATDFRKKGCPNCDEILNMKGSSERVADCTSAAFDGVIALVEPKQSWVAKWQRNDKHVPGTYAVRVTGSLPEEVVDDLEAQGVRIPSRDD